MTFTSNDSDEGTITIALSGTVLTMPTNVGGVGINTTTPEGVLDVVSNNSGIILPRLANIAAVTVPVNGMLIYDLSAKCVKAYQNNTWSNCLGI